MRKFAAPILAAGVLAACGPTDPARQVADYAFHGTLASSTGTPPVLVNLGPGINAFRTETVGNESRAVLAFPADSGLVLSPTTGVVPNDRFSIVILFRLDTVTGYRRIVDLKNGQDDCGLYVFDGTLSFFCDAAGSGSIAADTYVQVALTRDGMGNVVGYVDGTPRLAFADAANRAVIDSSSTLGFFHDNECGVGSCGEASAGAVARIRLYDDALTAAEIATLDGAPPPTPSLD